MSVRLADGPVGDRRTRIGSAMGNERSAGVRMRIEIPVFDGFDELDTVGPYEVLRNANQMGADAGWDVALVGAHGPGEVVAAHGLRLSLTDSLGHPDAVLAPGGGWTGRTPCGTWHEVKAGVLPARLAELALSCRWVASVCTWAILLAAAGLTSGRRVTTHHDALDDLRGALHITDPHRQRRADLDRQRPSPAASSPRPLDKPPPVPHGRMRTPTTQRSDATPPVDTSRSKSLLPNRRPTSSGSHALNTALSRCCQTLLATVTTATGRSTACHRDTTAGGSSAVAAAQSARVVVSRWHPNAACRRGDWNPHVLADTNPKIHGEQAGGSTRRSRVQAVSRCVPVRRQAAGWPCSPAPPVGGRGCACGG